MHRDSVLRRSPQIRRRLRLCLAVLAAVVSADCDSILNPSNECGPATTDRFVVIDPVPQPTNSFRDGGQTFFQWDHEVSGLCVEAPESGNSAYFLVTLFAGPQIFQDVNFEGRVYHAAFIQPYTARMPVTVLGGAATHFEGTVANIGLRQGNPAGGSATITTQLHMSMNSSGNIDDDLKRARALISSVRIDTKYRRVK